MEKKCAKCQTIKPLSEFSRLTRAADGLNYRCKICCANYYNSIYPKIRQKKISYSKKRYKLKRVEILKRAKNNYDSEKKRIYNKSYNIINKQKLKAKKNNYEKFRVSNDPNYRVVKLMRKMVYRLIKNKKDPTFSILGYSKNKLIDWFGRYPKKNESIDHKIPISWFNKNAPINIVSHYKNLQILTKSENAKKSNKFSHTVTKDYFDIAIEHIKKEYKLKIKHHE